MWQHHCQQKRNWSSYLSFSGWYWSCIVCCPFHFQVVMDSYYYILCSIYLDFYFWISILIYSSKIWTRCIDGVIQISALHHEVVSNYSILILQIYTFQVTSWIMNEFETMSAFCQRSKSTWGLVIDLKAIFP